MKALIARLRGWETALHRWNLQRVAVCLTCCGPLTRRVRRPVAERKAQLHAALSGHAVGVKRFG